MKTDKKHGSRRESHPLLDDRRLTGLAGPDYDTSLSFGLPIEPEDSQYGESWVRSRPLQEDALSPGPVWKETLNAKEVKR